MPEPAIPSPIEDFGDRPFSFYPSILEIEHNEWRLIESRWSEILVRNTKTGQDVWIPRRYLGEISHTDEPVMIVGLLRELEYKAGSVWPAQSKIIDIKEPEGSKRVFSPPISASAAERTDVPAPHHKPAESAESRAWKLVLAFLGVALVVMVIFVAVFGEGIIRPRVTFTAKDSSYLEFTNEDDYHSVVRKLGPPSADRWRASEGEIQYRVLEYKDRRYSVVLMGTDRNDVRYIGVMDADWKPLHYVSLGKGADSGSILRSLPRF